MNDYCDLAPLLFMDVNFKIQGLTPTVYPALFFPFSGCHVLDLAELLFSRLPGLFQVKVGL